jgi:hypothetical protein
MILVFEQDLTPRNGSRLSWRGSWFVGRWDGGRCWRVMWGLWSLSYYPSPGLRSFMDHIESGRTGWNERSPAP